MAHPLKVDMYNDVKTDMMEQIYEDIEEAEGSIETNDTVYFITWNPNNKFNRPVRKSKEYNTQWCEMICKKLRHLRRCCKKYCIIPEISDAGRLHCHGWIVIHDKIKWIKSVKPKIEKGGYMKMTKQKYKSKGFKYYKEDIVDTFNIITDHTFPLTYDNQHVILKSYRTKLKEKTDVQLVYLYNFEE